MARANDSKQQLTLRLDWRVISGVLALVIVIMLALWRPWQPGLSAERTIKITGETTIKAAPDEFVFSPSYELTGTDQTQLRQDVSELGDSLVNALKALGVSEDQITLNGYGGDNYFIYRSDDNDDYRAVLTLQVIVSGEELAQTVQDYLLTTDVSGSFTPFGRFSEAKQAELESQAREAAIADAKAKAEQSLRLLDANLGGVITVSEVNGFDVYPLAADGVATSEARDAASLPVLPGQNDYNFSVDVTFAID